MDLLARVRARCRVKSYAGAWLRRGLASSGVSITSATFSPDGHWILCGTGDRTVQLWDTDAGECLDCWPGHEDTVQSVRFSPDGRRALSGSSDETLRLWEVPSGKCLRVLEVGRMVGPVDFSPDGRLALSGTAGTDETLQLWDLSTGECLRTYDTPGAVLSATLSPDGRYFLAGCSGRDPALMLFAVSSGRRLCTLGGYGRVTSVAFSPDGRAALSGDMDGALRLWALNIAPEPESAERGPWGRAMGWMRRQSAIRPLRTLRGHVGRVHSVAFSPDGRYLLSGGEDGELRLWDGSEGECVRVFAKKMRRVNSASFSPDGRFALSAGLGPTMDLWELDWRYEFPGWADWDEGAEPYLRNFLAVRGGRWEEHDFAPLLAELSRRGYGWLRPEGVRRRLRDLARD